jgi:hypothetical protein
MPTPDCTVVHHGTHALLCVESSRAQSCLAEMGMTEAAGASHELREAARIVLALLDAGLRVETHRSH